MNEKQDLFDFEPAQETPLTEKATSPKGRSAPTFGGLGVKEGLILAFFILLGAAYLFWPFSTEKAAVTHFISSQPMEEPADFDQKKTEEDPILSREAQRQSNTAVAEILKELARFKKEMASILEARRIFSEENRDALDALSQQIKAQHKDILHLKQQFVDIAMRFERLQTQQAVMGGKKAPSSDHKHKRRPSSSGTAGYRLHALSKGMAWIAYQGSTYAVQEGDTVGNIRIHRIDAQKRQVDTSAGFLR